MQRQIKRNAIALQKHYFCSSKACLLQHKSILRAERKKIWNYLVGGVKEWENYILADSIFISHTVGTGFIARQQFAFSLLTGNKARPYNK